MRLNGSIRLLTVLSFGWIVVTGIRAYYEYPTGGSFGGIALGPFEFWSVIEIISSQTDAHGYPAPAYVVEPKYIGFLVHGGLPVVILWIGYAAIMWIWRGFQQQKTMLESQPKRVVTERVLPPVLNVTSDSHMKDEKKGKSSVLDLVALALGVTIGPLVLGWLLVKLRDMGFFGW